MPITPYATWDITLSPTTPGNVRFTEISGVFDLNIVQEGDLAYIYGTEFAASGCQGTFEILNVSVSYSGMTKVQYFEIANPSGVESLAVDQIEFEDLSFFRPSKSTIYDQLHHVLVAQRDGGIDVTIPATTIVNEAPGQAAYIPGFVNPGGSATAPTAGLRLWLDAARGITLDTGKVSRWNDQSGNALDVQQLDNTKQFTYSPTGFDGGFPALDGLNNPFVFMESVDPTDLLPAGSAFTIYTVAKANVSGFPTTGHGFFVAFRKTDDINAFGAWINSGIVYGYSNLDSVSEATDLTPTDLLSPHIYNHSYTGTGILELKVDGTSRVVTGADIVPETGAAGFLIGGNGATGFGSHEGWEGLLAEILVYDSHHSDAQQAEVMRYLSGKYGIGAGQAVVPSDSLAISSLVRRNGTVTAQTIGQHGLSVGSHVIIDGARSSNVRPSTTPGTPSVNYSSNVANGTTDHSFKTTISQTGTFRGFGQKSVRLDEGMAFTVGGIGPSYGGLNNFPAVLEVTSDTVLGDGTRQIGYQWTLLTTNLSTTGRREMGMSKLLDGRVLVTGGTSNPDTTSSPNGAWDLFTYTRVPVQNTLVSGSLSGGSVAGHAQVSLQTGNALICGGWTTANVPRNNVLVFNSLTNAWTAKAPMLRARMRHRAVTLKDGTVLAIGGQTSSTATLATCERYDPLADDWTKVGSMSFARTYFTAILLPDGRVLVVGGNGYNPTQSTTLSTLSSCEIYDPIAETWAPIAPMSTQRDSPVVEYLASLNAVLVAGGNISDSSVEMLDLKTLTWSKLPATVAAPAFRGSSAVIGNDVFAIIGGASNANLVTPTVAQTNFLVVPGENTFGGGGLNGIQKVTAVPDSSSFVYQTEETAYTEARSGATAIPVAATTAPAGVPGPFIYDVKDGLAVTSVEVAIDQDLAADQKYTSIALSTGLSAQPALAFPDRAGYLCFNYGYADVIGPVKYLGRLSDTELLLDASYKFPHDVAAGSQITLLSGRTPFIPPVNELIGNFYLTGSSAGRVAAQNTLDDTIAAGLNLNLTVIYPSDIGLGAEGAPTDGAPRLSDRVRVWGGDDLDLEIAKLKVE